MTTTAAVKDIPAKRRPNTTWAHPLPAGATAAPPASDDVETEAVDDRVGEHVNGVREKGRRVRKQAGRRLGEEHGDVDPEDELEDASLPLREIRRDLAAIGHACIMPERENAFTV